MKLSMWILAQWLIEYQPKTEISEGKIEIEYVRLFSSEMPVRKETVYIGRMGDLFHNTSQRVVCVNNNDILILHTDDMEQVLNDVLTAFEFYGSWHQELTGLLNQGCSLTDLLNASHRLLPYPAFILDTGQVMVAHTQAYGPDDVDDEWKRMVNKGSSDFDTLVKFNKAYSRLYSSHSVYVIPHGFFPSHGYVKNLFVGRQWYGFINMIDQEQKASHADTDLLDILSSYVEQWLLKHAEQNDIFVFEKVFTELLSGHEGLLPEFRRRLQLRHWQDEDPKMLLVLKSCSNSTDLHFHLKRTFDIHYQGVTSVIYQNEIVLLVNLSAQESKTFLSQASRWLKSSGYYGVHSLIFQDLSLMPQPYHQVTAALPKVPPTSGTIYNANDYMVIYALDYLNQKLPFDICHPVLYQLLEYDQTHNTDFFLTLYEYLRCERHQLRTAKALSIHRNTLIYRLQRLPQLINTDLDNDMVRMHILLSYYHYFSK